jgi:hypothetical protein
MMMIFMMTTTMMMMMMPRSLVFGGSATHDASSFHLVACDSLLNQGFFTDLALVSRARTGFVGQIRRSSTQLLLDLVEYDRKSEARDKYGISAAIEMEKLKLCNYWRPR